MPHLYANVEGWFNMEREYAMILECVPRHGCFVELGAWKGKSTLFVAEWMLENRRTDIRFTTVDTFAGPDDHALPEELAAYAPFACQDIGGIFEANTRSHRDLIRVLHCRSDHAAVFFADQEVDALFIDAGHSYESVRRDLSAWRAKIKPNGIIAGHDYGAWPGVGRAVRDTLGAPGLVRNDCRFVGKFGMMASPC